MSAKPFRPTDEQIERFLRRRTSPPSPALLGEILAAAEATPQRRTAPWGPIVIERRTLTILAAALLLAALAGAIAVGSGIVRPWPGPDAGYRNGEMVAVSGCRLVTIDPESGDAPAPFGEPPGCTRAGPPAYPAYSIGQVAWSADGSRLVFAVVCGACAEAGQELADDAGIWLLDAATREARQLVRCRRDDRDDRCYASLDISPDGSRVAFTGWSVGTADYGLYVLNADGTDLSRIDLDGWPDKPSFSPDGSLIAVAERLPGSDGAQRLGSLVVAKTDGSGVRRLVERPNVEIRTPTWQPGGRRIAFSTWEYPPSTSTAIWSIDPDGSNASELVRRPRQPDPRGGYGAGFPGWSPDGSRIAYTVESTPTGPAAVEWWVMSADGSEQRLLHASTGPYYWASTPASWSPDGRFIAFAVGQTDRDESGLFLIRPDGSDLRRVSESVVRLYWQPLP